MSSLVYFQSIWSIKFAYLTAICTLEKFKLFISDYLLIDYVFLMRKLNKEHLASIQRWCVLLWVCVSVYGCVGVNFYKLGLSSQCIDVLNIPAWVCSKKGCRSIDQHSLIEFLLFNGNNNNIFSLFWNRAFLLKNELTST